MAIFRKPQEGASPSEPDDSTPDGPVDIPIPINVFGKRRQLKYNFLQSACHSPRLMFNLE